MLDCWDNDRNGFKYPYNKWAEFLDSKNIQDIVDEYFMLHCSQKISSLYYDVVNYILKQIGDEFIQYLKDCNFKEEDACQPFTYSSISFWQKYIELRFNLYVRQEYVIWYGEWEYQDKLKYCIKNYPDMKYKISDVYIKLGNHLYSVGTAIGETGKPQSPFTTEIITNTKYEEGLTKCVYGPQFIDDCSCHYVECKCVEGVYEIKQEWYDELVKVGADFTDVKFRII